MQNPNGVRAILFDLDGTLHFHLPSGYEAFTQFLAELGYTFSLAQLHAAERWNHYYWAKSSELLADLDEFGGENSAFWERHAARLMVALEMEGDLDSVARRINQIFRERFVPAVHIPADVEPTLARLRAAGYVLGLVSNRLEPLEALVEEIGLKSHFNFTLSAGQAQSWKPLPQIFLQAVAMAGCAPEAAVYVGDNFYADVIGARGAGLRPVLVDPKGIFIEPGCPVIRTLSELEGVLESLGTKAESGSSLTC
jgi:HAD superfamily hydrolase (TIGR01509 family)